MQHHSHLIVFIETNFDDYVEAVSWAQEYAIQNRECMVDLVLKALGRHLTEFDVT